jgi:hypothetical protein
MSIKDVILESKFRDLDKVVHYVRKKIPHASRDDIKAELDALPKDVHKVGADPRQHYYHPIFTPYHGGYQIDLLQQSENGNPPFYLIAINVNTKYAYAYPLRGKDEKSVEGALRKFVSEAGKPEKVAHVSADWESAWAGNKVTSFLESQGITSKLITDQQHSALGVIDRFIRTLRDMAEKEDKRDISPSEMEHLLDLYNNSVHSAIGMTPAEMNGNRKAEKKYIFQKLYEQERREQISDYNLSIGRYVRFMIPRKMTEKRRYQVSKDVVKIVKRDGNGYICMAADGSVRTFQRWRLFPVKSMEGYKMYPSFGERGKGRGIIEAVIGEGHGKQKGKYQVKYMSPNGETDTSYVTKGVILGQNNGAQLLKDYLAKK